MSSSSNATVRSESEEQLLLFSEELLPSPPVFKTVASPSPGGLRIGIGLGGQHWIPLSTALGVQNGQLTSQTTTAGDIQWMNGRISLRIV